MTGDELYKQAKRALQTVHEANLSAEERVAILNSVIGEAEILIDAIRNTELKIMRGEDWQKKLGDPDEYLDT